MVDSVADVLIVGAGLAGTGHFGPADLRIAKRPECTPIIREVAQRVLGGEQFAALADWLTRAN